MTGAAGVIMELSASVICAVELVVVFSEVMTV